MIGYKNLSGESNVSSFEIGKGYIVVQFVTEGKDGCDTYKYTFQSAGTDNIRQMQELAEAGIGLNSFINKYVKRLYENKW